ncbi:MAG: glycosyltransferase [Planctomycetota bacterium]
MRVALVHESLTGYHGSERVLAALAALYPEAPIFVTLHHPEALHNTPLAGRDIRASVLDRLPILRRRHRLLLPLMPYAVEQHDLRGFDVVISSHHAAAHGVLTRSDQLHLCYTHSPARYAWDLYHDHLPPRKFAPLRRALLHKFRVWDATVAQRVDRFAANSKHVAARIRKTYRRDAEVIYPPVDAERFRFDRSREDFYVVAGRLVAYKNVAAVVQAFKNSKRKLVVIGDGPDRRRLRKLSGPNVVFLGALDEPTFADHLERCRALVFAGEEDFGMVPVEAMAAGAPVIAWGRGGVTETVTDGQTGVFFDEPTPEEIAAAVRRFEDGGVSADAARLHYGAQRFGIERFARQASDWIDQSYQRFTKGPA